MKDIPSKGNKKHKGPKMKAALVIILGILIAKYPFHWKLSSPYYINLKCRKTRYYAPCNTLHIIITIQRYIWSVLEGD